jgi:hypothetical protein
MTNVWYYALEGKSVGPLSLADMMAILSRVSNAKDVLVWQNGYEHWKRAANVPELAAVCNLPPPLQVDTPKRTRKEVADFCLETIEQLFAAQLNPGYKSPHDAFSSIITNKLAAGYVFGFHESFLQRFDLLDPNNPHEGLSLIETSYQKLFGDFFGGGALFNMTKSFQDDPDFHKGRINGYNELIRFMESKIPPLGLGRILILGLKE